MKLFFSPTEETYFKALAYSVAEKIRDMETASQKFLIDYYGHLPVMGEVEIPVPNPYKDEIPQRLLPFHEGWRSRITDAAIHFYINDQLFTRLFRTPKKYLPYLKDCKCVIGTDLSQYTDMPMEMRWRHALANATMSKLLQDNGVSIIPNITWSLQDSFSYSFPLPLSNSIIAINCNGVKSSDLASYRWKRGYKKALELSPSHIIRYGEIMDCEEKEISSYFFNERLKRLRNGR